MGFTPSYSMYPEYAGDTVTGWIDRHGAVTTSRSTAAAAAAQVREQRPDVVFLASPEQPDGDGRAASTSCAAVYDASDAIVVVDEAYAEFAAAELRAPSSCSTAVRAWSSPAR